MFYIHVLSSNGGCNHQIYTLSSALGICRYDVWSNVASWQISHKGFSDLNLHHCFFLHHCLDCCFMLSHKTMFFVSHSCLFCSNSGFTIATFESLLSCSYFAIFTITIDGKLTIWCLLCCFFFPIPDRTSFGHSISLGFRSQPPLPAVERQRLIKWLYFTKRGASMKHWWPHGTFGGREDSFVNDASELVSYRKETWIYMA